MKVVKLPNAPNPDDAAYKNNPIAYNRAIYQWMTQTKGKIEQASVSNNTPMDQAFVLGSYITNTSLSGTNTGTDVNNFILSICAAMMKKGIMKQN